MNSPFEKTRPVQLRLLPSDITKIDELYVFYKFANRSEMIRKLIKDAYEIMRMSK